MRVVINHILSVKDKEAIKNGQDQLINDFEDKILSNVIKLTETLSKEDEHFFKCLSYLVSIKKIEFVATISLSGGLSHDKYGIFSDSEGNKVAFIGSANFSESALELNSETITVFSSSQDATRIAEYQMLFENSWKNDTSHLIHIPIEKVKTFIEYKFPVATLSELLVSEKFLRNDQKNNTIKPLSTRLIEKIEEKELEPRFPFPTERPIQINAL